MSLSLKLLGEFALRDGSGAMVSLPTRKTRALLAYLSVNAGRPQPRERLMALLWSDRGERQARQSLNQALQAIRKLGKDGKPFLDSDGERVTLSGSSFDCDVLRLRALSKSQPAEAATLYGGPFLDGLSIPDPAFEEWLLSTRSELHALACNALEAAASESDDSETALSCARRLVALDPLREEAHRRLMKLLYQSGDRAGALRQYQSCADILKRELDVDPDAATRALFEELRRGADADVQPRPAREISKPLQLSEKPSVAVLPFDIIGGDPRTSDLADGLLEDLITALAKVRELFVIDRHSTEIYKGKPVNVRDVARELGVKYVLAGSIRAADDRMRCSVQLIDAIEGQHLWVERYDRPIEDVFALQDEIVWHILVELQVRLTEGDGARVASRGTRNLEAWLLRVQGAGELGRITREGSIHARALFEAAHKADPNWARPLAGIAGSHYYDARYCWSSSRDDSIAAGVEYAERAISMDPDEPFGYVVLSRLHALLGKFDDALRTVEKAVTIAPNDQLALGALGAQLMYMDQIDEAVRISNRMVRLGPNPHIALQRTRGLTLMLAGRNDQAIEVFENLVRREPKWRDGHILLAAAYANAERLDQAQTITKQVLEQDPAYTASNYISIHVFRNPERIEWLRRLLLKAGSPE